MENKIFSYAVIKISPGDLKMMVMDKELSMKMFLLKPRELFGSVNMMEGPCGIEITLEFFHVGSNEGKKIATRFVRLD